VQGMTLFSIEPSPLSPASCVLALDIAGNEGSVQRTASEIERFAVSDEGMILLQAEPVAVAPAPGGMTLHVAVRPTDLPSLIAGIEAICQGVTWTAFPVLGVINIEMPAAIRGHLDQASYVCGRLGGALTVERCPIDLKREIDVFGPEPPSIGLMRRVKREFDPLGILSPGRFLGKI